MSSGQRRDQIRPLGYKEGFHRVRQTSMSKLLKSAVQNGFLHTFTRLPFPPNFKLAPFFFFFTIEAMPRNLKPIEHLK